MADHLNLCRECETLSRTLRRVSEQRRRTGEEGSARGAQLAELVESLAAEELLLGRYRMGERLGHGGEGWVYAAVDTETGQRVAIKFGARSALAGFVNAQSVVHENICPVHYTTVIADVRLVVMRFIPGGSLESVTGELRLPAALAYLRGICAGLSAIHAAGLVHLDIKPGNILLDGDRPVIADFGVSARTGSTCERGFGTRGYMPPEQREGGVVTSATDVFAVARLFRQLLLVPPPRAVQAVLDAALADDPSQRPQSTTALLAAIEAAVRAPRRWWRLAWLAPLPLALLLSVLVAPSGERAAWHAELGQLDTIPRASWNVLLNRHQAALPRVESNTTGVGCARNLHELADGLTSYQDLQHGFAFAAARPVCLPLTSLRSCGLETNTGTPCQLSPHESLVTEGPDERRGQLQPAADCRQDVALTVTLARAHEVSALRAWFRQGVPRRLSVLAETESGTWQTVYGTRENLQWTREPYRLPDDGVASVPVTLHFTPLRTQRLRLVLRCDADAPSAELMWLFELEVFAGLAYWQAWPRKLASWWR